MSRTTTSTSTAAAPKRRCAVYTRKSTTKGLEQEYNSLDAQEDKCKNFIAFHDDWQYERTFSDAGISGGTTERPALQELISRCQEGEFDIVVVYKIDRMARCQRDFLNIIDTLNQGGVEFASATEAFDSSTYMGRAMRDLLGVFAEMEREMIRERTREKAAASRQRGLYLAGQPPMGYKRVNKHLRIVPSQAKTIRRIFTLYAQGESSTSIALILNKDKDLYITNKGSSKKWSYREILRVLKRPLYAAYTEDSGTLYEAQHEAIIEREQWHEVQSKLDISAEEMKARLGSTRRQVDYPLRSLMQCLQCGHKMEGSYSVKKGKLYRYYECRTHKRVGKEACSCPRLQADEVERFLCEQLETLNENQKLTEAIIARMPESLSGYVGDCLMRIDKLIEYASPQELQLIYSAVFELIGFDPSDESFHFKYKEL